MYTVSSAFLEALKEKHPIVRPLIRFSESPVIFTGEDIDITSGLIVTEYANPEEDLTIGSATSSELQATILNSKRLLNDFQYGECQVSLGVRIDHDAWIRGDSQCTAIINYGTNNAVRIDGYLEAPFIKVNNVAPSIQPPQAVYGLVVENNTVYGIYESGDVWTAVWNGSQLVQYEEYTWSDMEQFKWLQLEARQWSEFAPATDLSDFMRNKLKKWYGRGLAYRAGICHEFLQGFIDTYEYVPLGVFDVATPSKRRGQKVEITANDRMVRFDEDATDWWNALTFPLTVQEILQKVCTRCNVPLATSGAFINSDRKFETAPFAASALTYRDIVKWIAEGACSFARMSRNGALELSWYKEQQEYVNRYFNDFDFAEYNVSRITGLQILNAENDVGILVGSKGNVYQLMDSPIFYGLTTQQEYIVGQPIQQRLSAFGVYTPMQITTLGNWAIQAGDIIFVESNRLPIFKNTITYAGYVRSNYQSTGEAARAQASTESRQLYQQKRNIHQLQIDVQGIRSHLEDTDGNVTDLQLFAKGLTIQVTNSEDNTSASLDLRSGKIALASQQIRLTGLVSFTNLKNEGETVINGGNITTGYLSADRIKGGTIDADEINVTNLNADNITSGTMNGSRITDGSLTTDKYGDLSIVGGKIDTDAIINRHIQSGSIYPSTCNDTINGYFADVIYATKIVTGQMQADNLWTKKMYAAVSEISALTVAGNTFMIDGENYRTMKKDLATYVIGR